MFLQVSVILSTRGVCLSACWDTTPPGADTPQSRHPPGADTPLEQTPPRADTSPQEQTPPLEQTPLGADPPEQTPLPPRKQTLAYGQRAAGTHATTGMHSC